MVDRKPFGRTKNGREVTSYTLHGVGGLVIEVLDWGGRVNRICLPNGRDVAIGFDSPAGWEDGDPYYGCLIGRYANRIGWDWMCSAWFGWWMARQAVDCRAG